MVKSLDRQGVDTALTVLTTHIPEPEVMQMADEQFNTEELSFFIGETCGYALALQEAVELAYDGSKEELVIAKKMIKQADIDFPAASSFFLHLKAAVEGELFWHKQCAVREEGNYEFDLHAKFKNQLDSLMPGAEILKFRKEASAGIPDFLIKIEGEILPVEIKRYQFKESSLRQLQRYILGYGCTGGIAVAPELACELPPNIRFVRLTYDMANVKT